MNSNKDQDTVKCTPFQLMLPTKNDWKLFQTDALLISKINLIDDFVREHKDLANGNFDYESATFNGKWNERYGNALMAAATAHVCMPTWGKLDLLIKSIYALCNQPSWAVMKMPHDEVNRLHLVAGMLSALEAIQDHAPYDLTSKVTSKLHEILNESLTNKTSQWYADSVRLHNHCFHILTLRYLCLAFLEQVEPPSERVRKLLEETRQGFKNNFRLMCDFYDGLTFESASYLSYSFASIVTFLHAEKKIFGKHYKQYQALTTFIDFIDDCYVEACHWSYNFSDAPPNWSYGPEFVLRFLDDYFSLDGRGRALAHRIEQQREKRLGSKVFNRNWLAFFHLNLLTTANAPKSLAALNRNQTPQMSDGMFRIYPTGLLIYKDERLNVFMRGGRYGGAHISAIQGKNFGHDYPGIGSISVFADGIPICTNPLYLTPKRTAYSGAPLFIANGSIHGQRGSIDFLFPTHNSADNLKTCNWINSNDKYEESPIAYWPNTTFLRIFRLENRNYAITGLRYVRWLVIWPKTAAFVIDVIQSNREDDVEFVNRFVNAIETYQASDNVAFVKGGGTIWQGPDARVRVSSEQLKCHEFSYNLAIAEFATTIKPGIHVVATCLVAKGHEATTTAYACDDMQFAIKLRVNGIKATLLLPT